VQLLPLSIGLIIRKISADLGEEIGNLLLNAANTLFIVILVFLLGISLNIIPLAGWSSLGAIAIIVPLGLIVGHFLGGTDDSLDTRATLATATIARNLGLVLFIAIVNGFTNTIPVIITYGILGAVLALPYNVWIKKQIKV
jgi:BASS family bile acid:Na+ symporter